MLQPRGIFCEATETGDKMHNIAGEMILSLFLPVSRLQALAFPIFVSLK
jgi:hypothetical protein